MSPVEMLGIIQQFDVVVAATSVFDSPTQSR
jgi:hypothetical protein